jgi:ABC-type multidrug transport system ATPase subunit
VSAPGGAWTVTLTGAVGAYGGREVVGPVHAHLESPGLYWVAGGNGAGKSTLLRLIAGLRRAQRGAVHWHAGEVPLVRADLRGRAALAAPEIHLYEDLSTSENLEWIARLRGDPSPRARARAALETCGLAASAARRPHELSSGMRQRARLSAAWIAEPPLLLLDEPSSNLDADGRAWLWREVRARAGRGLVVVATNVREEIGDGEPLLDLGRGMT